MQYATTHGVVDRRATQPAGFMSWTAEIVQRLRARLDERARYLQTRDELMALSDRELNDIGLSRTDVDAIARQSARLG